jgi:hypothetical protein
MADQDLTVGGCWVLISITLGRGSASIHQYPISHLDSIFSMVAPYTHTQPTHMHVRVAVPASQRERPLPI